MDPHCKETPHLGPQLEFCAQRHRQAWKFDSLHDSYEKTNDASRTQRLIKDSRTHQGLKDSRIHQGLKDCRHRQAGGSVVLRHTHTCTRPYDTAPLVHWGATCLFASPWSKARSTHTCIKAQSTHTCTRPHDTVPLVQWGATCLFASPWSKARSTHTYIKARSAHTYTRLCNTVLLVQWGATCPCVSPWSKARMWRSCAGQAV